MFLKSNYLDTAVFYKIQVSSALISSRCQGNKTQDILFIDIVADRHRNNRQKTRKTVSPDCMKKVGQVFY